MRHALSYGCVLYGTLLVQALWGGPFRQGLGLKLALGFFCGLALAGWVTYGALALGARVDLGTLLWSELIVLVLCAGAFVLRSVRPLAASIEPREPRAHLRAPFLALLSGLGLIALGGAGYTSVCSGLSEPFGSWDAFASWNLKARCLFLNAANWKLYVTDNRVIAGADYPLLLPCLVARGYSYAGGVSELTAALLGPLFSYGALALLFFGVWHLKSLSQGLLASLFWLGTPGAFNFGASQYGDLPVGAYLLATLVALAAAERHPERRRGLLVLAGLLAGAGAFLKHEGQMFLLILGAVRFLTVAVGRGWKSAATESLLFLGGSLPGLAAVLSLRAVSDSTGFFAQNAGLGAMLAKLLDASNYAVIVASFWRTFTQGLSPAYCGLLAVAGALGLLLGTGTGKKRTRAQTCAAALPLACVALAVCGYAAIFLMTPMDLRTHLTTTAYRFFVQVYPALFFGYFLMLGTLEEAWAPRATSFGPARTGSESA